MHQPQPLPEHVGDLRNEIVGIDTLVPVLDGTVRPYIFLDNAASTPAFKRVVSSVDAFMPWYSGVHRGTGFKSLLATELFDGAHEAVLRFVGATGGYHTAIFGKNTTECVNKLANRFPFSSGDVVVTTLLEHHSNDLPWRKAATVVHVGMLPDGRLDLPGLRAALDRYAGRVKLVAVTGASNITGLVSPVHLIAEWAHAAGARVFVDAAQLAPHRPLAMHDPDQPSHIDFLAISAHKMYAPFGTGVLVGPRQFFERGDPDMVGGGVVDVVTLEKAYWNHPPQKEEAGSPNVVGGVALAEAIAVLESVGMDAIAAHETHLLEYAYRNLRGVKGITFYGPMDDLAEKVGVVAFNLDGFHHSLVSAVMGAEMGIGVRDGCFCAHPYVKELLGLTRDQDQAHERSVLAGDKSSMPGMVRASFGCYSNEADIDELVDAVQRIVKKEFKGVYVQDARSGGFYAENFQPDYAAFYPYFTDIAGVLKVSS
jgi:cysteine desulfurase/selenocysteine lyase